MMFYTPETFIQKHSVPIGFVLFFTILFVGIYFVSEWNDEQYFKTLDKLTCEQIWTLMQNANDWDTTEYFGERCNR